MGRVEHITVEVVYALPNRQWMTTVRLPAGSTIEQAIRASGVLAEFADIDLSRNAVGVFGALVQLDEPIADRNRIEIYRPLTVDPKEARRRRAAVRATKKG